ncbi:MAG: bifunctional proline dehydrogenase/L-glutamate gamma-semialdehyde dehydrogenase, partial [Acidimicrobiales bacterium]
RNIARMAKQFIVGTTPAEVAANLEQLWRAGSAFTVDLLGEKTLTEAEADHYAARVDELVRTLATASAAWAPDDHLERDDLGALPRVNVSVKPTALAPRYAPLTGAEGKAQAAERLRPLLRLAADHHAFVWLDMEHYDVKDLTLELFTELLDEPALLGLDAGIVLQAYLKDTRADLRDVISWSASRLASGSARGAKPIGVRLVKGAYWDAETIHSRAEGWPVPMFEDKAQTDANYERLTQVLHDHHGEVRAAFGTHNLRSLAYAVTYARHQGIPDAGYELQMLHGMAEPVHAAIRRLGLRLRVYAPMGELVPGMSYLIRRLLENTSNEGFVRARFAEGKSIDQLVAAPAAGELPEPEAPAPRPVTEAAHPSPYHHEPVWEWRSKAVRRHVGEAVEAMGRRLAGPGGGPLDVPAVIGGESVRTGATSPSVDPADPESVVALAAACGTREADEAVAVALRSFEAWHRTPVPERAQVLFRTAGWLRAHREEVVALEVFEAGKPWGEADGDVCEAVDFCEYYGREMLRLGQGGAVESPPGEANALRYQAKGVGVVISPWNFPLAIPCGMVVAALVAGNAVVLKPAEQTPAVAGMLVRALLESGLPPGALSFLPGDGEVVGGHLVRHRDVSFIAFTGSLAVGLGINSAAAQHLPGQRHVKRVVAEMGGKNAVVVDADADLDQVVPAVVYSAFGYAGQKCSACSRLVVVDDVHDEVVRRLVGAARELEVGHPRDMAVSVGPLIEAFARDRVAGYVERGRAEGKVVLAMEGPDRGFFVGPTVVDEVPPTASVARDEIFGPVLSVLRAASFDDALVLANDTDYALTAGVFSRSPSHIAMATTELRAGNVYVNRGITGAVPGRHPFGGYGLSGVGSKAGGPDYLLQFLDPRVVTENTLRQGFAPTTP